MEMSERKWEFWRLREWHCCGHLWQLLLSKKFPERENFTPICPTCSGTDTMKNIANKEEEKDNVVTFEKPKLVYSDQGGKEPPSTTGDWLSPLPIGSCFYVRSKIDLREFVLGTFRIAAKTEKTVILQSPTVTELIPVIPQAFCNKYTKWEDLGVLFNKTDQQETDQQEEGENPNEHSDRDELTGGSPEGKVE